MASNYAANNRRKWSQCLCEYVEWKTDELSFNVWYNARIKRDYSDEGNIVKILEQFKVFAPLDGSTDSLHSIATKDVAIPEIQESLSAEELGQSKLDTFVEERLVNSTVKFRDRLQKSNPLTCKSLYEVSNKDTKGKVTTMKADRTILQRLVTAFQAGRKVGA